MTISNSASSKKRQDIRCLSLGDEAYLQAKELAQTSSVSVSGFLRQLIKKAYQRNKKQLQIAEVE